MRSNLLPVFIILVIFFQSNSFAQGISFREAFNENQYDSFLNYARKNTKPICLYVYSPDCPGCAEMNKRIFNDARVASVFNLTYLNIKVNFNNDLGHFIAEKYQIQQLPSVLFTDPSGHNLAKIFDASVSTEAFRQMGISTASMFYDMLALRDSFYVQKPKRYEYAKQFAFLLAKLNYFDEGKTIADVYFRNLSSFNFDQYEWFLIQTFHNDVSHPLFNSFLINKVKFEEIYGKDKIEEYLTQVFETNYFRKALLNKDSVWLEKTLIILDYLDYRKMSANGISRESAKTFFRIEFYRYNKNWESFATEVDKFFNYSYVPEEIAADYILDFYRNISQISWISKADQWAMKNYKKNKNFLNTLAYASTRYRLNDKQKAEKLMKKAEKLISDKDQKALFDSIYQTMSF